MSSPANRRPDASMTLLAEVMERPLDPGYAAAAERRKQTGEQPSKVITNVTTPILLALIALLTVAAVLALRAPGPEATSAKDALLQRIKTGTADADRLQRANDKLRAANDKAQAAVLALQAQSGLADQLQELGIVAGSLAVQGPGLRITVHDAPSSAPTANADPREQDAAANGRVLDRDLQIVVNGLWSAGAEAISINGQRLTALSAIRSAGQAILVDFRPLSPPYVVSAIGPTDSMRADFAAGSGGTYLHSLEDNYGIDSDITSVSSLSLPASSGLTLHDVRTTSRKSPTSTESPS
ncbi:MAG: DUF881 domain-containing protein [Actinomycetota bacterium]|nr:DUF881 domain-containing protein [Actinomycetota bacterium]